MDEALGLQGRETMTSDAEITNLRGSITVPLTYYFLFGFSCSAKLNELQFYLFGQIQTSQTGGQPYSDASPNDECFLSYAYQEYCQMRQSMQLLYLSQ